MGKYMLIQQIELTDNLSISPYNKCSNGCLYCFSEDSSVGAVPKCLKESIFKNLIDDLDNTLDFEGDIIIGGLTEAYPPIEKKLKLTREVIKTLVYKEIKFSIKTKSDLILRDLDFLKKSKDKCKVIISLCCSNKEVLSVLEPKATALSKRINTITELQREGINVEIDASPWIPGVTNIDKMMNVLPEGIKVIVAPFKKCQKSIANFDESAILEKYLKEIERFNSHQSVIWSVPN